MVCKYSMWPRGGAVHRVQARHALLEGDLIDAARGGVVQSAPLAPIV
jgi:hypothetical protein